MSTHIIDHIIGIALPLRHEQGEQFFVIVHEGGDNNVIEIDTNRRARSWYVSVVGTDWEILREACKWASDCCGGCVKVGGRHTEPETFIRRYRKAMENALTLDQADQAGVRLHGIASIRTKDKEGAGLWKLDQLKKYEITLESKPDTTFEGSIHHECPSGFDLRTQFNLWFDATNNFHPRERLKVSCHYLQESLLRPRKKEAVCTG